MTFSVDGILNNSKIAIEKAASDTFGSVVEDFARGGLGGIIPKQAPESVDRKDGSWYSTSYAAALAGGTGYRPKLKFLFKVKFNFTPEALAAYNGRLKSSADNSFTFMIKSVDRPKIDFEYEEDVNMYNFRTKVLKRIRHKELTIIFLDDTGNKVFDFYRDLMMIHSPITARQIERDNKLNENSGRPQADTVKGDGSISSISRSGMSFSKSDRDNASRAVVNSTFGNSIESIQVQQIFVNPSLPLSNAVQINSFDFMNPRIMSFDFDELSHEANEVSTLTMVFDYDWLEMVKGGSQSNASLEASAQVVVPGGIHGAPSDVSASGNPVPMGGNGVTAALSGIFSRSLGELTQDTIGKAVSKNLGNGALATALGGKVSSVLGGLATSAVQRAVSGIGNSLTRASVQPIKDSDVLGPTVDSVISVPASDGYGSSNPGSAVA
jgi:hypothetical protein